MDWIVDGVVLLLSWAIVGQHIWATRGHFVSDRTELGARLLASLVIGSTVIFSLLVLAHGQPAWAISIGLAMELASMALFWGAIAASREAGLHFAFDPALPGPILERGPYRWVRHPFYASYLLFWFGWAIAAWSLWTLPLLVGMVTFYLVAARGEERRFFAAGRGTDYERYRRSTGLFWPRLPSLSRDDPRAGA
jgi:protein-S-isoprenylcysteine O-methyltransferase Ste14